MNKLALAIALITALAFVGCGGGNGPAAVVEIYTPVPEATSAATPAPTEPGVASPAPTAEPTPVPREANQAVFDDAVFIGNSVFEGLDRFGVITHGVFLTKVGLSVSSIFTSSAEGSTVPLIDELNNGRYKKAILYFGTNELGWQSYPIFIERYGNVIDAVLERQPGCRIFVCGVLPTSRARDEKNENGINNANITRMNSMIMEMCEERDITYIEVPEELIDADGRLPEDASSDGIHLTLSYDRKWVEHICLRVMGVS